MVPTDFIFLDSLPLTPNGKINRLALPAPYGPRPDLAVAYTAPQSDIERLLAEIWAEVLAIGPVGIHDDFFDLGGHSLAATRVLSRVLQKLKLNLPVQALFDAPTVARMLSRVIWGARTSLGIAGISVLVAMLFGVMIGLLSGYYGGWLDMLVMRLADMTARRSRPRT